MPTKKKDRIVYSWVVPGHAPGRMKIRMSCCPDRLPEVCLTEWDADGYPQAYDAARCIYSTLLDLPHLWICCFSADRHLKSQESRDGSSDAAIAFILADPRA